MALLKSSKAVFSKEFLNIDEEIAKTETEIKRLIANWSLFFQSKQSLIARTNKLIYSLSKKIKNDVLRKQIMASLIFSRNQWMKQYETQILTRYYIAIGALLIYFRGKSSQLNKSETSIQKRLNDGSMTPGELYKYVNENKDYFQHGVPQIKDYYQKLKKHTNELADESVLEITDKGKRKMNMSAKAERTLRHDHQMDELSKLRKQGHRLCWISSHSDCSERCQKWQGKLVDLEAPAINSNFETGEVVDGYKVYSFKAITSVVDKYGWYNNIIVGFNCRHYLTPYTKGSHPPIEYSNKDIERERRINDTMRKFERNIRMIKKKAKVFESIDVKVSKDYMDRAKFLTNSYINFAKKNGFAYYPQRLKV